MPGADARPQRRVAWRRSRVPRGGAGCRGAGAPVLPFDVNRSCRSMATHAAALSSFRDRSSGGRLREARGHAGAEIASVRHDAGLLEAPPP